MPIRSECQPGYAKIDGVGECEDIDECEDADVTCNIETQVCSAPITIRISKLIYLEFLLDLAIKTDMLQYAG